MAVKPRLPASPSRSSGRAPLLRIAPLALIVLGTIAAVLASATTAEAKTKWLCKPGKTPDPCRASLKTTVISSDGRARIVSPERARHPKIDCFYVYPTVSTQPRPNATLHVDPEETGIARDQASRFSQTCRVFAPMYRQVTPQVSVAGTAFSTVKAAARIAYRDVRAAWREYLARFNHGRGVVLIGHSQGSIALTKLIREEIDLHPKVRRRLVSAILPGGDILVKEHEATGGDFRHVPACRSASQTSCVIAYSSYDEPPLPRPGQPQGGIPAPDFGYPPPPDGYLAAWGLPPAASNLRILCTNPASLSGGRGALDTILPSVPPTALIGGLWGVFWSGNRPTAPTPWVTPQDHYSGRCVTSNGARVLMLSPIDGARQLVQPLPGYGLHFLDVEIALGNLTSVVKREAKAYLKQSAKR